MNISNKFFILFLLLNNFNYNLICDNTFKDVFFIQKNERIEKIKIGFVELKTEEEINSFEDIFLIEPSKFYFFKEGFINKNIIAYIKKNNKYELIGRLRFGFEDEENTIIKIEYLDINKDYQKNGIGSLWSP
jgi:hypothetical protein